MSASDSTSATFNPAIHVMDGGNGSSVGGVDATSNFVANGGDGAYRKPAATGEAGTVYVTCGAAGKLSSWVNGSWSPLNPAPHPVFSTGLLAMGSMIIEIDGNTLHAIYIDQWNTLRDDFTIIKGGNFGITAADNSFAEQGADDAAVFNITRSGATSFPENVIYQTGGSATPGTDFAHALSGTISFAANETSRQITLTRARDQNAEGPEAVSIALLPASSTVADGTTTRQRYFLTANASANATLTDAPSQQWWFDSFGAATLDSTAWALDTDGDGLSRIEELAFGGAEGTDDHARAPSVGMAAGQLVMRYFRNPTVPELRFTPQRSGGLTIWYEDLIDDQPDGPAGPMGIVPWRAATSAAGNTGFMRLGMSLED